MAYHPLSNDTGGTPEDRLLEVARLLEMVNGLEDQMTSNERDFVMRMHDVKVVSPKQLFWLRDIKDKYL